MPSWVMASLLVIFVRFVRFLKVFDVVCMTDIPNLVGLSQSDMLFVLVGIEIDPWVMVLGLFGLFDECIFRAFFSI